MNLPYTMAILRPFSTTDSSDCRKTSVVALRVLTLFDSGEREKGLAEARKAALALEEESVRTGRADLKSSLKWTLTALQIRGVTT